MQRITPTTAVTVRPNAIPNTLTLLRLQLLLRIGQAEGRGSDDYILDMGYDVSYLRKVIANLYHRGYIVKRQHPRDGRRRTLYLSEKSHQFIGTAEGDTREQVLGTELRHAAA